MMQRLFVMSTEAILSIDQRTMSLKYRIPLAQIEKISASPYTDRIMVFHIKKVTSLFVFFFFVFFFSNHENPFWKGK